MRMFQVLFLIYSIKDGVREHWSVPIVFHNVYGKYQKNHFIPEFLERSKKNKIKIFGWKNKRCWLHVEDFCSALNKVINSKQCKNKIINIGSNYEKSVYDLAKLILKIKYPKIKKILIKDKAPKGSTTRRVPDINKIYKLTKWKPAINIKNGLMKTIYYE